MQIQADSDFFNSNFLLISLGNFKEYPERFKTTKEGKKVPNLVEGKPTYRTSLKPLKVNDGVPTGEDPAVSISLIHFPAEGVSLGSFYRAKGKVFITPYLNNGRIFYSIVLEGIELLRGGND